MEERVRAVAARSCAMGISLNDSLSVKSGQVEPLAGPGADQDAATGPARVPIVAGAAFSVVIPTFNERENVPILYERLIVALDGIDWEAVFVDDDSPDGTWAAVNEIAQRDRRVRGLRRVKRRGLSSACIEGILASSAPIVAVMDGDLQHDETRLPLMYEAAREGAGIVVGSRYADGGSVGVFSERRQQISGAATWLAGLVLKQPVSDPLSGFFALRRETFEDALPRLTGSGFKILLDVLASVREPVKVVEIPFTFGSRVHGDSKLDTLIAIEYLELLLDKMFSGAVPVRFLLFATVGGLGLIVHLAVLRAGLTMGGLEFASAQALATFVAMTTNFLLNNRLTYRDRRLTGWRMLRGLFSFYGICAIGAVANVGAAALVFEEVPIWWVAGTVGAMIGAVWNFALSSLYTWRSR